MSQPARSPALLDGLIAKLDLLDLAPGLVHAAWESARLLCPAEPTQQRDAVTVLLLAAQVALAQGHSHLPIGNGPSQEAQYTRSLITSLAGETVGPVALALLDRLATVARKGENVPLVEWQAVIGRPGARTPLILDDDRLYVERIFRVERALVTALQKKSEDAYSDQRKKGAVKLAVADVIARPPRISDRVIALSDRQIDAVTNALSSPLTMITGGPGTGKTSVVVAILRGALRLSIPGDRIALATPTGKAGQRLADAINGVRTGLATGHPMDDWLAQTPVRPVTLHRLLGYRPDTGDFRHHERNPLAADLVLIDEASMIDLFLMERLLAAIPQTAALVLIGDPDQLPSVQAGAAFRDMAHGLSRHVTHLDRSFRVTGTKQERTRLLYVADLIKQGDHETLSGALPIHHDSQDLKWQGVELLTPARAKGHPAHEEALLNDFLEHWMHRHINGRGDDDGGVRDLIDLRTRVYPVSPTGLPPEHQAAVTALAQHADRARLLAVTRSATHPTGTAALNATLHNLVARGRGERSNPHWRTPTFLPGEPVMVERNDYDLGLWNGDQGIIIRTQDPRHGVGLSVAFVSSDAIRILPLHVLTGNVTLAYALTVHKAQGSEYDQVALVLPSVDLPISSRQLIYTAITRSRHGAVLVGRPEVLVAGIQRRVERLSGLPSHLG